MQAIGLILIDHSHCSGTGPMLLHQNGTITPFEVPGAAAADDHHGPDHRLFF